MEREAALHFRNQFRHARALVLRDAEAFDEIIFVVERMGMFLDPRVGTLKGFQRKIESEAHRSPLASEVPGKQPQLHIPFKELYDLVEDGRNWAMHQGAVARHLTGHATKLAIVLEDALMHGYDMVRDFMVQNPVCAELWQPLSLIRQTMLENYFSFLPVNCGPEAAPAWKLVSDLDVARYLRAGRARNLRLVDTLLHAQECGGIKLRVHNCCKPEDSASTALKDSEELPILVTDTGKAAGRLLGIVTTFDLL
jgi:CBS domain-containing protein